MCVPISRPLGQIKSVSLLLPVVDLDQNKGFVPDWKHKINPNVYRHSSTHRLAAWSTSCFTAPWPGIWNVLPSVTQTNCSNKFSQSYTLSVLWGICLNNPPPPPFFFNTLVYWWKLPVRNGLVFSTLMEFCCSFVLLSCVWISNVKDIKATVGHYLCVVSVDIVYFVGGKKMCASIDF